MVEYWLGTKSSAPKALELSSKTAAITMTLFIFLPFQ
jgi:hypothetical protein